MNERKISFDLDWKFKLADDELLKPYEHWLVTGGFSDGAPSFSYDDAAWETVHLPHDFVVSGNFTNHNMSVTPQPDHNPLLWSGSLPGGVGWYRKRFSLAESDQGKRIYLFFDGVFRESRFYLNQCYLGSHKSGYSSFYFDITDLAEFGGENLLTVRVDATLPEGWFYEGGGIYRHAWIVKIDPVHIAPWGTYITSQVDFDSGRPRAAVKIRASLVNKTLRSVLVQLVSTLIGPDGMEAGEVSSEITIPAWEQVDENQEMLLDDPELWSPDRPDLYQVISTIRINGEVRDTYATPIGIRSIRFDAENGFFLNEQPLKIKGVCCHQDYAGVGTALPDGLQEYRIRTLKEMGCNAYRTAHNPPTPELLDACDRLGMLVMDENRRLSSAPEDLSDLESLIRRDRNHPSVILWSIGNEEVTIQMKPQARRIARTLVELAHKLDPTRPVTLATTFWIPAENGPSPMEPIPYPVSELDVMGFNYNPAFWEPFHQKFPSQPIVVSEATSDMRTRGCYQTDDAHCFLAWEMQRSAGGAEVQWAKVARSPYLSGIFIWTGFDYRGEPYPQGWPGINSNFGIMDTCGFPKDNYYYYKAVWTCDPLVHLFPHWNWPGREGQPITVGCYTNCEEVELFLNGQSLGRQAAEPNFHLEWKDVIYAPGLLEACGYRGGQVVTARQVETTGAPQAVRLRPNKVHLASRRRDVEVVNVEIVDERGRVVPDADPVVTFRVDGPAEIIGVGNGNPGSHEADHASHRRAFHGLCQVILQAGEAPGPITLSAAGPGLLPARVVLENM